MLIAFFGGFLIALTAAPLGVFLVWNRLSYVADAFAHAALLAGVFALLCALPQGVSFFIFAFLSALLIAALHHLFKEKEDTLLLLFASGAMSVGLALMHTFSLSRENVMRFLQGAPQDTDTSIFLCVVALTLCVVIFLLVFWKHLISSVIAEDVARTEGIAVGALRLFFFIAVFFLVLLGVKWSGALFLSVFFICPLFVVQPWTIKPQHLLLASSFFGAFTYMIAFYMWQKTGIALGPTLGITLITSTVISQGVAFVKRWLLARKGLLKHANA